MKTPPNNRYDRISAAFLAETTISKLRTYMDGFYMCKHLFDIKTDDTLPPFWLFFNWICKEYNHSGSYYSWDGIILQNSDNNEEIALETFFKKFDEFREIRPTNILVSEIGKTEVEFFFSHEGIRKLVRDGKESRIGPSNFLYVVKYNSNLGCSCHHHKDGKHINSDAFKTIQDAKSNCKREYGPTLNWKTIEQSELAETYKAIV